MNKRAHEPDALEDLISSLSLGVSSVTVADDHDIRLIAERLRALEHNVADLEERYDQHRDELHDWETPE